MYISLFDLQIYLFSSSIFARTSAGHAQSCFPVLRQASPNLSSKIITKPWHLIVNLEPKGSHQTKKRLSFGHCPKGGEGVQPESKSFEVVLFSPSLAFFWTLNGGRGGGDHVPKVLRHFLPKYWVNI